MHSKGCSQFVVGMTASLLGILEVVLKHGTIVGMCHLDKFLSLLHIALMTQVCHAILGDDSIDIVVRMVDMAANGTMLEMAPPLVL